MTAEIRRATVDDLEALLDLREAVAAEGIWIGAEAPIDREGDRAKHRATIDAQEAGERTLFLVAEVGGRPVGSLAVFDHAGIGGLGMNVADGHREQGIGVALMEAAVDWARSVGLHKLELEHWPWNHRARALYERFGFVEEGYRRRQYRRRDGALWDAVLMGAVLDDDAPGHPERATEPPPRT